MGSLAERVAMRFTEEAGVDAVIDHWADLFLDEMASNTQISESDINTALHQSGLTAEGLNSVVDGEKYASGGFLRALGGLVLKGVWHMVVHPFLAISKLIQSETFRTEVKAAFKKALRQEIRASRHMLGVAERIALGEEVNPQERKAAMSQFVSLFTRAVLLYFAGPRVTQLFTGSLWKALSTVLTPLNEIIVILLDKPLRAAGMKLMRTEVTVPSSFQKHL